MKSVIRNFNFSLLLPANDPTQNPFPASKVFTNNLNGTVRKVDILNINTLTDTTTITHNATGLNMKFLQDVHQEDYSDGLTMLFSTVATNKSLSVIQCPITYDNLNIKDNFVVLSITRDITKALNCQIFITVRIYYTE